MIAYPALLWTLALGGYLMARSTTSPRVGGRS
jgi:hypothetical protein